ncbi:MAG: hypothetical protein ACKVT0_08175 [Planctomycetaceae bacterium]
MSGQSLLSFGRAVPPVQSLSDVDFLRQINWRQSTSSKILHAVEQGDKERFQEVILKELADLVKYAPSGKTSGRRSGAEWSFYPFSPTERFLNLKTLVLETARKNPRDAVQTTSLHDSNGHADPGLNGNGEEKKSKKVVQSQLTAGLAEWLHETRMSQELSPSEWLLLTDVLISRGAELAADVFCRLWRTLLTEALNGAHTPVEQFVHATNVAQQVVIIGEIPWRAGLIFSQVKGARAYRTFGEQSLEQFLLKQVDEQGLPPAEWLPQLADAIAAFFRVWTLAAQADKSCWNAAAEVRCGKLLLRSVALCLTDGTNLFHEAESQRLSELYRQMCGSLAPSQRPSSWQQAFKLANEFGLKLDGSERNKRVSKAKLLENSATSDFEKPEMERLSANCEEGRWAAMRSNWKPKSAMAAVVYQQPWPMLAFHAMRQTWFDGAWEWDLTVDGQAFSIPEEWNSVCWTSDEDGDYLELQKSLTDDIHFERQIMLARRDNWLFVADSFSGLSGYGSNPIPRLEYAMRLHLGAGVQVEPAKSTRDVTLIGQRESASITAYPLALPQDREQRSTGDLTVEDPKLVLRQTGIGDGLYAPLMFDLSPATAKTIRKVWRTLTVSENMGPIKPDVASGHRLQLGDRQWMIYHSLKNSGYPRSVLGHHTQYETLIGRFGQNGNVTPLLMIEPQRGEGEG